MTAYAVAGGVMLPAAAVWLLLHALRPERRPAALVAQAGAALAFALGLTSVTFFLWRLAGAPLGAYTSAEATVLVLLSAGVLYRRFRRPLPPAAGLPPMGESRVLRVACGAAAAIVLVASLHAVAEKVSAAPHGEWDAWAIWNLRAAFLATPGEQWTDGFSPAIGWSAPEHPLLVPASVARLWTFQGTVSSAAPVLFAMAVWLATMLVVAGSLLRVGGYAAAGLGLALLLVPDYSWWAASQTADVALGLFIVLSVSLLSGPHDRRTLVAAGAAAGLAAWTKGEGLVAALAIPGIYAAVVLARSGWRVAARNTAWLLAGVLPVLGVLVLFSVQLAPPSRLMADIAQADPLAKLLDLERHRTVAAFMFHHLARWGRWEWLGPVWLVVGWLAIGWWSRRGARTAATVGIVTVAVMLASYYTVYVLVPYDLIWQMQVSWVRLVAQVWPLLAWTAATALARRKA